MNRSIAFLHAINVGGRIVANSLLREQFEVLGFQNVRSFISTGNIVFQMDGRPTQLVATAIQTRLKEALGYEVPTFLRSEPELHALVKHRAFDYDTLYSAKEMHVGLLAAPLSSHAIERLMKLRDPQDHFHVNGREIYWLCRSRRNASTFSADEFTETLHVPITFRPLTTLVRMIPWIEAERPSASRLGVS